MDVLFGCFRLLAFHPTSSSNSLLINEQKSLRRQLGDFYLLVQYLTSPFTILEPQNPWIHQICVVKERSARDFKAPKLGKGSSGSNAFRVLCGFTFLPTRKGYWKAFYLSLTDSLLALFFLPALI